MHTGDLATMDEQGYVNIVGRLKDMVIRGGENVYPREIEEFLYRHPKVQDVQVIGVPDPRYGEEICAWIKLRDGQSATAEEIREFCKGQIAHYKVPALHRVRSRVSDDHHRQDPEVRDARADHRQARAEGREDGLRTLFDKIWDAHVVERLPDGTCLLFIDRHLLDEHGSPQAFDGLRAAGRTPRRPDLALAVADHNIPTENRAAGIADPESRQQVEALERNVAEFGIPYIPVLDRRQGIVHVIGPELGFSLPGTTIVSGDSHASTHGALGALAFGIGASEVEQVLATQTLLQQPSRNLRVEVSGALGFGCTAKDVALAIVGRLGMAGGTGHAIEYAGDTIRGLDMAGRMTVCNMSIETGARVGLIAPDETTFDYLRGPREGAERGGLRQGRRLLEDAGERSRRVLRPRAVRVSPGDRADGDLGHDARCGGADHRLGARSRRRAR
jgi:hypothetical protein